MMMMMMTTTRMMRMRMMMMRRHAPPPPPSPLIYPPPFPTPLPPAFLSHALAVLTVLPACLPACRGGLCACRVYNRTGNNALKLEGGCNWAVPGTWTAMESEPNTPCHEGGDNCNEHLPPPPPMNCEKYRPLLLDSEPLYSAIHFTHLKQQNKNTKQSRFHDSGSESTP